MKEERVAQTSAYMTDTFYYGTYFILLLCRLMTLRRTQETQTTKRKCVFPREGPISHRMKNM